MCCRAYKICDLRAIGFGMALEEQGLAQETGCYQQ